MKNIYILATICFFSFTIQAQWIQKGIDINGEEYFDHSGCSIAINSDGNIIAIGANENNSDTLFRAGQVRVYEWSNSEWLQKGSDIDGEYYYEYTGASVSMSSDGNTILIGANKFNDASPVIEIGPVRVFHWNGFDWIQKGSSIFSEMALDYSGSSVSMSSDGNTIAIGAPLNDQAGDRAGHVRIYEYSNSEWIQKGFDIDGESELDRSGMSVSLNSDGNIVAIGAGGNDNAGSGSGHVRIYEWNNTSWIQKGGDIEGEAPGDYCGGAISLNDNGNTIAIGAGGNFGNEYKSGHVRVFEWNTTMWLQKGTDIDGEDWYDYSGSSVSINSEGNRLIIGAPGHDSGNNSNSGNARVFEWNNYFWMQSGASINGVNDGDESGGAVTMSSDGNTIAIGAKWNDGTGYSGCQSGHVRVYFYCKTYSTDIQIACDSLLWINGNTYTTNNNTATHILTNVAGCDSIVTLNLTINNSSFYVDTITACDSLLWIDGITYTNSNNSATHTLTNVAGCDSIITLNLTLKNSTYYDDVIIACDSLLWIDGNTYTTYNNTATHTLTNVAGCDSIVTLNLTINNSSYYVDTITACDSFLWSDGITYTNSNNSATYTLINSVGCDSVITLNLTIISIDNSIIQNNTTLSAIENGDSYQWVNCPSMMPINGANAQNYTPTTSGDYALIITKSTCIDTSTCHTFEVVGIIEKGFSNRLIIYPNPTDGNFSINLGENYATTTVTITNLTGQVIQSKTYNDKQVLNLELKESAGIYLLNIESEDKKSMIKIVKK